MQTLWERHRLHEVWERGTSLGRILAFPYKTFQQAVSSEIREGWLSSGIDISSR